MHRKTWSGWSSQCLVKWKPFLYLGLPSMVLVSEWWASEVAVLSAGYLAQPQLSLSAMAIYQNSNALAFMLPAGMAVRLLHTVGWELVLKLPGLWSGSSLTCSLPPWCCILGAAWLSVWGLWCGGPVFQIVSVLIWLVSVTYGAQPEG